MCTQFKMPKHHKSKRSERSDEESADETWDTWEFPFGKYKGEALSAVIKKSRGKGYVKWLLKNDDGEHPQTSKFLKQAAASVGISVRPYRNKYQQKRRLELEKKKSKDHDRSDSDDSATSSTDAEDGEVAPEPKKKKRSASMETHPGESE